MLKNFVAVALRQFIRQRFYSVLNIVGLSSGLTCALFIFLWVRDETQIDSFHRDASRIFHIVSNLDLGGSEVVTWPITPGPLRDMISNKIPGVELSVRTMDNGSHLFQYEDKSFLERGYYADSGFFDIFSFPILEGDATPMGRDKSALAISKKLARNLFGEESAIGKMVKIDENRDFQVVAVFDDLPNQSSLRFDFILAFQLFVEQRGTGFHWGNYDHPLFLKLSDPEQAAEIITKINEERDKLDKPGEKDEVTFFMQPFLERYLFAQFKEGKPVGGRIEYVRIFSIVALFIVLIACINFMNMATARAGTRAKEVGVRKVVGAGRSSLMMQFISESLATALFSMLLALLVVIMLIPAFNSIVGKDIQLNLLDPDLLTAAAVIVLVTGLLAGSYPAFFLSSYKPVSVLKGESANRVAGGALRKVLVVFQFSLTVILIASALVIYNQVEFIRSVDLGYNRKSVLTFGARGELRKKFDAFQHDALQIPGIAFVSKSNSSLVQVNNQNGSVSWPGKPENSGILFRTVVVDYDYLETMGVTLEQGRLFSREYNDSNNCVITRRSLEVMGLKDPIGQEIVQWGTPGKIVGVVNDIHSRSLHEAVDPVVFLCKPEWTSRVVVRFSEERRQEALRELSELFKKYSPEYPFEYTFMDDDFEKLYNNERVIGSLAFGFTVLAIIISGLGLLGLAAYTAERRKKEISIRKVLGASLQGIILMITGDFVLLTSAAVLIGVPTAWWLMEGFLEGYAYHIALGWEVFALTSLLILLVALGTVIFQVARAALANPVDALRNE